MLTECLMHLGSVGESSPRYMTRRRIDRHAAVSPIHRKNWSLCSLVQAIEADSPGAARQLDSAPLTECIEPESFVEPNDFVCVLIHKRPVPRSQMHLHKLLKLDLAQEADALAVPPSHVWQVHQACQKPYLLLNGKHIRQRVPVRDSDSMRR